jgi:hypothetical protein
MTNNSRTFGQQHIKLWRHISSQMYSSKIVYFLPWFMVVSYPDLNPITIYYFYFFNRSNLFGNETPSSKNELNRRKPTRPNSGASLANWKPRSPISGALSRLRIQSWRIWGSIWRAKPMRRFSSSRRLPIWKNRSPIWKNRSPISGALSRLTIQSWRSWRSIWRKTSLSSSRRLPIWKACAARWTGERLFNKIIKDIFGLFWQGMARQS